MNVKKHVLVTKQNSSLGAIARTSCLFVAVSLAASPVAFAAPTDAVDLTAAPVGNAEEVLDKPLPDLGTTVIVPGDEPDAPLVEESPKEAAPDIEPEPIVEEEPPIEAAPLPKGELCKLAIQRQAVVEAISEGIALDEIAEIYDYCSPPVKDVFESDDPEAKLVEGLESDTKAGNRAALSLDAITSVSVYPKYSSHYEELGDCGYHPQRREFVCPVKIKRQYGYGGKPPCPSNNCQNRGSFEWVQICVYYPNFSPIPSPVATEQEQTCSDSKFMNYYGWRKVNTSAVHVHDEQYGAHPPWDYAVVVQADPRLHRHLVQGRTLYARAVLSWGWPVSTNNACSPQVGWFWGDIDWMRIRLDP
ncbi:hypothetical protein QUF54_07060 [Candidatus Marithioploca araucensis]|uniref:Uncharacterized protein n=1 Tax=Candidatus Marithioploca araucensis TaxID=70273 RepID=A0ABT7VU78_9GAMM|nr:hypothetical protein [Candidatus Marithioploca araucensis]